MTILKLELQVAVYKARLRKQILSKLVIRIVKIHQWTKSLTPLQWLQAAHKKQKVFVVNRAAEILGNSFMDQLGHVKGVANPADIGTRRMSIEGLRDSVWLNGHAYKRTKISGQSRVVKRTTVGYKQAISALETESQAKQPIDWNRYNSFSRITYFIACCMRFTRKQKGPLKEDEIHQAEQILFRFVQSKSFANVSKSITSSNEISETLNLAKTHPS